MAGYGKAIAVRKPSPQLRNILAVNVRNYRKRHGISQEKLPEACELHRTYIGSIERCERNVTLSTLEVLAAALHVTVPELLTSRLRPLRPRTRQLLSRRVTPL